MLDIFDNSSFNIKNKREHSSLELVPLNSFLYILSHINLSEIPCSSSLLTLSALNPCTYREGVPGHMCSEHAAVWWSVTVGDSGHVRRPLLLPQGLQWRVTDPAGRFPNVPGLRLPLRSHAQVQLSPTDNMLRSLSVLHEHSYKLLCLCADWNRPRRTNRRMRWRTWSTWSPVWPHMGWLSWNPPAWQPEPPSCCLALFSRSPLGKVC